jgi:hypothetical protein
MTQYEFMELFGLTGDEYLLGQSVTDAEFWERYGSDNG